MADADRLPRTGNIYRAAGLEPTAPSLPKPTTAVSRVYPAHFLGSDVARMVGCATGRRAFDGQSVGQRAVEWGVRGGLNDRRAADPRVMGVDGPPSRGGAGGIPPQARPRVPCGLGFECHGSAVCLWAPTRRGSAPVRRLRRPARLPTDY